MIEEEWVCVPAFGCLYEASTLGRIRSKARSVVKRHSSGQDMVQQYAERLISGSQDKDGYMRVHLSVDGRKYTRSVHHLVLMAFHGFPDYGYVCRHLNGDPSDNRPENLKWGTHAENMQDRKDHGRYAAGSDHPMTKLTEGQVKYIRECGLSGVDVSKMTGVGTSQVSRIRNGQSWGGLS
jgi:hypothetical protein